MNEESAVPSLEAEINRKAIETLRDLMERAESGTISPVAFHLAVHTIWKTVSGLVREDIATLLEHVDGLHPPAHIERRIFEKLSNDQLLVAILERHTALNVVRLRRYTPGVVTASVTDLSYLAEEDGQKKMNKIAERMLGMNYQEV